MLNHLNLKNETHLGRRKFLSTYQNTRKKQTVANSEKMNKDNDKSLKEVRMLA